VFSPGPGITCHLTLGSTGVQYALGRNLRGIINYIYSFA
jgi:hypothetical protein